MNILDITKKKYYQAVNKPDPLVAGFCVTNACNLRCKLCGAGAGEPEAKELTTDEAKAVIENLHKSKVMHISFGGGEPLVRDDILELLSYAARRVRSVGVVSNGFVIDKKLAYKIAAVGVKQVMISMDGADQKTHDSNRGEGSYDRAVKAVEYINRAGMAARISFTISRANCNQLPRMIDLAKKNGASLNVQEFFARGRAIGKDNLVLTREERKDMQRLLFKTQNEMGAGSIGFENRYIISEDKKSQDVCTNQNLGFGFYDFCVGCFTGIYSFFISPAGEVRLCGRYAEGKLGNLKSRSLSNIWHNSPILKEIRNRENLSGRCGKCAYRYICGGCRRNAYHINNDIFAEDPLCWRGR